MSRDRTTQLVALLIMVAAFVASGLLLPKILDKSEQHGLRYTNVSVEGAPPFVALGTAIGAFRGLKKSKYLKKVIPRHKDIVRK